MQYPYPAPPNTLPFRPAQRRKTILPVSLVLAAVIGIGVSMLLSAALVVVILLASVPQVGSTVSVPQPTAEPTDEPVFYTTVVEPTAAPPRPTTTHIVEAGQELGLIARMYNVELAEIIQLNRIANPDILHIGQQLIIPAAGLYQPSAADAPAPPTQAGKAIVVSVSQQRIYAYENGQMIRSHLVSTGRAATPTVLGDFRVYVKYLADDMAGPGYFQPQVPYTMYFYRGYAIHGAYWHNSFGRPMSHGCVNLPVDEANWFYQWAEIGTPVRVIA